MNTRGCAGAASQWRSLARCLSMLFLAALLGACSEEPARPDLGRLYRAGGGDIDPTPVIVIPGVFGSRLRNRAGTQ